LVKLASRTFVGTNLSPLWERFLVPSEGKIITIFHLVNSHTIILWLPYDLTLLAPELRAM